MRRPSPKLADPSAEAPEPVHDAKSSVNLAGGLSEVTALGM